MPQPNRSPRFEPNSSDDKILQALIPYPNSTNAQLTRYLYRPTLLSYVKERLSVLSKHEYVYGAFLDRNTPRQHPTMVYSLDTKGVAYLRKNGIEVDRRYRPSDEKKRSKLHRRHASAMNGFFISAELLARELDTIEIPLLYPEQYFKRLLLPKGRVVYVDTNGKRERIPVLMDGYMQVVIRYNNGDRYRFPIGLEMDLATEKQYYWRKKIRGLLEWYRTVYPQLFNTQDLTICVVTPSGTERLEELLYWTELELEALGQQQQADLFCFTSEPFETGTPSVFFFGEHWYVPFSDDPTAPLSLQHPESS